MQQSAIHEPASALVVPQFNDRVNRGGLCLQVRATGNGSEGIEAFMTYLRRTGMKMGEAILTRFDGAYTPGFTPAPKTTKIFSHPEFLIHVTTARAVSMSVPEHRDPEDEACYRREQWHDVQNALADAFVHVRDANIKLPDYAKIRSINIPLLGCGVTGALTYEQSAQAILQIVHDYSKILKRAGIKQINLTTYNAASVEKSPLMFEAACKVLKEKSYEEAIPTVGDNPFDLKEFLQERDYNTLLLSASNQSLTGYKYKQIGRN